MNGFLKLTYENDETLVKMNDGITYESLNVKKWHWYSFRKNLYVHSCLFTLYANHTSLVLELSTV